MGGPARLYVMVKGADDGDFSTTDAYTLRVHWTNTVSEFPDVPATHRYHDAIMGKARAAYVNGYADGRFGPDDPVKRQQFAKMIALAAHLAVTEAVTSPLTDLPPDDPDDLYPNEYIAAVPAAGITTGVTPTTFGPGAPIKFAQIVTMVTQFAASHLPPVPDTYVPPFDNFEATHYPWARIAAYYHLLDGIATPYDWFRAASRGGRRLRLAPRIPHQLGSPRLPAAGQQSRPRRMGRSRPPRCLRRPEPGGATTQDQAPVECPHSPYHPQ